MLAFGALGLMVSAISAMSAPATAACPVQAIGFAPPLGQPLQLTRQIERELGDGQFSQVVTYRLTFSRAGRGYRMRWQQTGQTASGPAKLLRLMSLRDDSADDETLDFTLDEGGAILGVTEAPDAAERLASAIDRLRHDPAYLARPANERQAMAQMFDSLLAMEPAERADMHRAKAGRLLVMAGRPCTAGTILGRDGTGYAITEAADPNGLVRLTATMRDDRADGSAVATDASVTLSSQTGLAVSHDRRTIARIGTTARSSREWLSLSPAADDADDGAIPAPDKGAEPGAETGR